MKICLRSAVILALLAISIMSRAEDAYYSMPLRDLKINEGKLPDYGSPQVNWTLWQRTAAMQPYAVLDGPGEAYIPSQQLAPWIAPVPAGLENIANGPTIAVRAPKGKEVTGRVFMPKE